MKNTSFLFLLIAFTCTSHAQNLFGIFAGPQTTTSKYTLADTKQPGKYKYGFQAGACLKIPFETRLFFSPAAFYSLKGYKVKFNRPSYPPDSLAIDNNTIIHTFELAFLLQFDLGKQPDHFFIKAGPSLDFQIAGREKFNLQNGSSVDRRMVYSFGEYGHYSVSLLTQLGFETHSGFVVFAQYTLGLSNISNADYGPQIKHRTIGISVGKYFNKKKVVLDTRNKE
jgi:Outer membrane protein beta-barrel domain